DSLAGYHRVRFSCAARAIENQVYTVHAPTVGDAPWLAALDVNIGAAAFFAPPDSKMFDTGILAQGTLNAPQWVYADLDLECLQKVREDGDVFNARDWELQPGVTALPKAELVTLT